MKALMFTSNHQDSQDFHSDFCGVFEKEQDSDIIKEYEERLNKENKSKYATYKIRHDKENNNWDIVDLYHFKDGTIKEALKGYLEFEDIELNEIIEVFR